MEPKRKRKQIVIPIFYRVRPREVREQSGIYEAAFEEHERCYRRRRVQRWRNAMTEAAKVSGWDSSAYGRESELEKDIANGVETKLESISPRSGRESSQIATLE
ncbi:TMV resistance protein N-like [Prosopis cineraria]|uniref:TMV resistance protein N-like n=1 Tax=Prosopis cineraria TaxID=364024 RepID=UPI00240F0F27|nr:TMV resistance protein N-like [Prosopis cineraria]